MNLSDFDYHLPESMIAQHPTACRDQSRLLVLDKASGMIEHRIFRDILEYLTSNDILVVNDTRVFPARLNATLSAGAECEVFLVRPLTDDRNWLALVRPGRRVKPGRVLEFGDGALRAEITGFGEERGERTVRLTPAEGLAVSEALDRAGRIPLPPYIRREADINDRERYQTVYANAPGAVAAPTAGLHFTDELLEKINRLGIKILRVTLHVGPGTFRPVETEDVSAHHMDSEYYHIGSETVNELIAAKRDGKRIIAVGTTSVRTLESAAGDILAGSDEITDISGFTTLFIRPGFKFRLVDALITNFHLPRSTLLMLVSALAGRDNIINAYSEAVDKKYRFYSYGDAMFIR